MRKGFALLLAVVLCLSMAACGQKAENNSPAKTAYPDKTVGFQLEAPQVGEQIAIMHTSMGDIYIRFFPDAAPKAVENFIRHSENGYYNNLTFHRVIEDFMIQGGDPKGDGTGGESYWGDDFKDEFDAKLLNLRGSLAMANSGVNTNGSQFFINQRDGKSFGSRDDYIYTEADIANLKNQYNSMVTTYGKDTVEAYYGTWEEFKASYMPMNSDSVPDEVWDLYEKHGGNISLDGAWRTTGGHTVFGQVFKGMDVVDAIAAVDTDDSDKPLTAVTITRIEITTYKG